MSLACEDIETVRELAVYRPRRPQETVLHRVLSSHLETYLALRREDPEREALPDHVERTFRGYLRCGITAHGVAHRTRGHAGSASPHTAGPCCWRAFTTCCRWFVPAADLR